MSIVNIKIDDNSKAVFNNRVDYCVGTGRMGLALTKEYLDELKMVQEEIGFKHIRGHGLFCDDVAIFQEYEEDGVKKVEYNYTYLDRIFDEYLRLNIRPFIELGFMPYKLASGTQTVFYWKGNTTPPKDYKMWTDMVVALLKHLCNRYGEEVLDWPIEVWNEPNLPGFWEHADMEEYFKLFKETFLAIKAFNPAFKVGGPAICGVREVEWTMGFLEFCKKEGLKIDSFTRHHYTIELPKRVGHYEYSKLMNAEDGFKSLQAARDMVDSFEEFKGIPIHITEFNTSYTPLGVIHDTNMNAALIARQLSRLGDMNESYSYWTFGDVFEEAGVPFTPFHGGFGMVANGCIRKPTFWTFAFYKKLKDISSDCAFKNDNAVIVRTDKGYAGVLWNVTDEDMTNNIELPAKDEAYSLVKKIVDEDTCNPLKVWHDLGEPSNPDEETKKLLRESDSPLTVTDRTTSKDNHVNITIEVKKNGLVFFELRASEMSSDRGYDYEMAISYK